MLYKRRLFLALVMLLLFPSIVYGAESKLPEAPIYIDRVPIKTSYLMSEGHLMVPALYFKNTGVYVDWSERYRSIVFKARDKWAALPVEKRHADVFDPALGRWVRHPLPTPTMNFAGEWFVPFVDVAKMLGMDIAYDPNAQKTYVTTHFPVAENSIRTARANKKWIALTFDDGPDDVYTPKILRILKEKGVPATFFVVGERVAKRSEMIKQIDQDGHGLGNHTWSHPDLRKQWSATVREEIQSTQNEIQKVLGKKPDLFRPPYGAYTKGDMAVFNDIGMRNILWSVDTLDWSGLSADEILEIVLRDASSGGIVLQHNFQSKASLLDGTVEALPRIIDELREQGYTFVTVQTLLDQQQEGSAKKTTPR